MDDDERSEPSPLRSDSDLDRDADEEDEEDDEQRSASTSSAKPSFRILTTAQLEQWITANNQIDVGVAGNVVWTVSSAKHGNGVRHLMHCHDLNTFWQSDGVLPHVIRIRLGQLTPVEAVALYVNSAVDQSYSPRVMKVKAGTHEGDMTEVAKADIGAGQECGWVLLELGDRCDDVDKTGSGGEENTGANNGKGTAAAAATVEKQRVGNTSVTAAGATGAPSSEALSYKEVSAVLSSHGTSSTPMAALTVADRWLWCTMLDICICENQFNGRDCHLRGICLTGPRYEEVEKGQFDAFCAVAGENEAQGSGEGDSGGERGDAQRTQDWLLR